MRSDAVRRSHTHFIAPPALPLPSFVPFPFARPSQLPQGSPVCSPTASGGPLTADSPPFDPTAATSNTLTASAAAPGGLLLSVSDTCGTCDPLDLNLHATAWAALLSPEAVASGIGIYNVTYRVVDCPTFGGCNGTDFVPSMTVLELVVPIRTSRGLGNPVSPIAGTSPVFQLGRGWALEGDRNYTTTSRSMTFQ